MSKIKSKYIDGTTIKTINGQSILGQGEILIDSTEGQNTFHIGPTPPEDTSKFWIDTSEEIDFLTKDNQIPFTPLINYAPATKSYVDQKNPENIDKLWGNINGNIDAQEDLMKQLSKVNTINVMDFGAIGDGIVNDTLALQGALDYANTQGGGMVYIPAGTYLIEGILVIYSNTTLTCAHNTCIKRNANISAMIVNGSVNANGYEGQSNIIINGGEWDANTTEFPSKVAGLAFGHGRNITIRDLLIKDTYQSNHISLNGVLNVNIINCVFKGGVDVEGDMEMIGIGFTTSAEDFPWFGNYDDTPCENIKISECTFQDSALAGVGSHVGVDGGSHQNLKVVNNHFCDLQNTAVSGRGWGKIHIQGNTIRNCEVGIYFRSVPNIILEGINISNNTLIFENPGDMSSGIFISCSNKVLSTQTGLVVHGNVVQNAGRHGIILGRANEGSVSHNTVLGCGGSGIYSFHSDNITFTSNRALLNDTKNLGGFSDMLVGDETTGANTGTAFNIATGNIVGNFKIGFAQNTILYGNHFINTYDDSLLLDSSTILIDGSNQAEEDVEGDMQIQQETDDSDIVDSGMNSLGYWYRLVDGTQHCYMTIKENRTEIGVIYTYVEFPHPFATSTSIPPFNDAVAIEISCNSDKGQLEHNSGNITYQGFDVIANNDTTEDRIMHIFAAGRWS